ncbi:MAG TPA: SgcJ/EcaC family oxidoreductase [Anaerolineales bacterium]|nr:SgcJ/EcaC family oxidoreductase [Anaerolineales bacterium]
MRTLATTERGKTESAIRKVFEESCAAWNRGDLDGYLASYWDSEKTLWISSGSLTRGKAAIAAAYKRRFSMGQPMGKLSVAELEIDVLTPDDAIAFGRWILDLEGTPSQGFFTVQLRKIEGTWLFVCDHASASS